MSVICSGDRPPSPGEKEKGRRREILRRRVRGKEGNGRGSSAEEKREGRWAGGGGERKDG